MSDRRIYHPKPIKSSELPPDYVKMVTEVLTSNFEGGLKALAQEVSSETMFRVSGAIYPDEVLVRVSLAIRGQLAATTVHASADFDPKASSPRVDELLGACVDAIGTVLGHYLDEKKPKLIAQLADESISALEEAPFEWTKIEVERFKIFVRMDKANPEIDALADDWLAKNDPEHHLQSEREQEELESLFVTGPKDRKPGGRSH